MSFVDKILTSLHGRRLGLTTRDELVSETRDVVLSGVAYANTAASTAVSNTTTETEFDVSWTMPANFVRAGSVLKIKFQGIATATNSTDTLAIKLYIGGMAGTALLTLAARDVANNDIFYGEATVVFRTVGASGTLVASGVSPTNPSAAGSAVNMNFLASTAVDTTATQKIAVSATWSAASAGDSCRLDMLVVEVA